MTYRILLDEIVGYKIEKPQNRGPFNGHPVLLTRKFSEVADEFYPRDVEDELLYLRMR